MVASFPGPADAGNRRKFPIVKKKLFGENSFFGRVDLDQSRRVAPGSNGPAPIAVARIFQLAQPGSPNPLFSLEFRGSTRVILRAK